MSSSGRRPGRELDARLDDGVDVDVVALRLSVTAFEVETQPGERPAQRRRFGSRHQLGGGDGRLDLGDRAPVGSVAAGEDVPLGIGHLAAGEGVEIRRRAPPACSTSPRLAPRCPLRLVRWVAASAPGLPLPFDREWPSNRWSSRPTAPLPPTGLKRSKPPSASVSSPSSSSCNSSLAVRRGTCVALPSSGALARAGADAGGDGWCRTAPGGVGIGSLPGRDGERLGRRRRPIARPTDRSASGPTVGRCRHWRGGPGGPRRRGTAG